MPNFIEIAQSAVEISQFLDFSKWRLPLSWIFQIFKFLTVRHAKKVEPLHCAKFQLNRLNPGRHMVIFYYSRWRPPPSWILKISDFQRLQRSRGSNCITLLHFVEIARTVLGLNHVIWAINRENRSRGSSWACDREKRTGQDRKKVTKGLYFTYLWRSPH